MNNKIKEIRIRLGLSETQISSLLYISSYKYRRYEKDFLIIPVEVLVLLSIMYHIPIDLLIFDKFSSETIFEEASIKNLLELPEKERFAILKSNICKYCSFSCDSVSYRVVNNILVRFLKNFSKNLQVLRYSKLWGISEIASTVQFNVEYYINLESGKIWPSVVDLIKLSSVFDKSVNEILGIKNETDF